MFKITVLFRLTNFYLTLFRAVFSLPGCSLPLLYTDLCLLQLWSDMFFFVWQLESVPAALEFECECFLSSRHLSNSAWRIFNKSASLVLNIKRRPRVTPRGCSQSCDQDTSSICLTTSLLIWLFNALTEFYRQVPR